MRPRLCFCSEKYPFYPDDIRFSFLPEKWSHFTQKTAPKLFPNGLQITKQVLEW